MEILNLALKNFKGHEDEFFEFTKGTNAICGENGAGKTSIFEAIAWVLFDHCDYQKTELIRTGAKSANAAVEFISSLDGRCYRVKRNTQRGYEVFDPQLSVKLNVKKRDDVQMWLREHLGVPRNTELSRLFAETIGIPQGTFTADFLKRPGDRKKIFDPILKVEDYKQTYENTRNLETYAKAQVSRIEQEIELATAKLTDWETLQTEAAGLEQQIAQDSAAIAAMTQTLKTQEAELTTLQAQAKALEQFEQASQDLAKQAIRIETQGQQLAQSMQKAQEAQGICAKNQAAFDAYVQSQKVLQELQQKRDRSATIQQQVRTSQDKLNQAQILQSSVLTQLESLSQIEVQIEQLQANVPLQEKLEQQLQQLQQQIQTSKVSEAQVSSLSQQIQQLEQQAIQLNQALDQVPQLQAQLQELPGLETDRQQVLKALGSWEISQDWLAKLQPIFIQGKADRDRHRTAVQAALKYLQSLKSERFTEVEEALKDGAILNTGLLKSMHQLLQELNEAASPEKLEQKQTFLYQQIAHLQGVRQQLSLLEAKQQQLLECDRQQQVVRDQLDVAQQQSQNLPALNKQQAVLEADLEKLENPKGVLLQLQRQLSEHQKLQRKQIQIQQDIAKEEETLKRLLQDLAAYDTLEKDISVQQNQLSKAQAGHQLYLQHQQGASQLESLSHELEKIQEQRSQLEVQQGKLKSQQEEVADNYQPERLNELLIQVRQSQGALGQLQGGLKPKQQRLAQVSQQLQEYQTIAEQRERDRQQLIAKKETLDFIQEARRIYNQSGPRITEFYQQNVCFEADRLLRELLRRQDVALRWTEDYDIQVQDAGHWRTFKSLSGGEQMCAALAVRLALLKTLGDINVAFFDEPTTNMDGLRRAQLAEAIANLKSFHQLFVISHDDTFESITESIIRLKSRDE